MAVGRRAPGSSRPALTSFRVGVVVVVAVLVVANVVLRVGSSPPAAPPHGALRSGATPAGTVDDDLTAQAMARIQSASQNAVSVPAAAAAAPPPPATRDPPRAQHQQPSVVSPPAVEARPPPPPPPPPPAQPAAAAADATPTDGSSPAPAVPGAEFLSLRLPPSAGGCVPRPPTPLGPVPNTPLVTDDAFKQVLAKVADASCDVLVTAGNSRFVPMLLNLINTSIRRWQLSNFLVVGLDADVCSALPDDVVCYKYPGAFKAGNFGSAAFATLVNVKTEIVMAVAQLGYNSLLVDGDIVFLQNPMPTLRQKTLDLQIQDDAKGGRNSGFMYTRATPRGLQFLATALSIAQKAKNMRQQPAVNAALKTMAKYADFKMSVLPDATFPNGMMFFERPRRMFAYDHPCTTCIVMHNNWIVGSNAKVYRFKEHMQWMVDTDEYYSSPTRKYLEVGNPYGGATKEQEEGMLKAAMKLGRALGRTVILPDFRCHGCSIKGVSGTKAGCSGSPGDRDSCSFLAHWKLSAFEASFGSEYREHMFRYNPMVPAATRLSLDTEPEDAKGNGGGANVPVFVLDQDHAMYGPPSTVVIPSVRGSPRKAAAADIVTAVRNAGAWDAQVVRFAALYNVDVVLPPADNGNFDRTWEKTLTLGSVRQY